MAEQIAANAVLPSPAWNSAAGICDVRPSASAADAEQGLHRALIIERVHRYGWALDEKRDDLLADCFSPGGIWEGTVMGGPMIGPVIGRDEIVSWLSGLSVDQDDQRRHSFSNLVVEFLSPTTAVAHAYVLLLISRDSSMTAQTSGPYRFELGGTDGVWRIDRLTAGFDAPF